jgi:putative two-component system response regulator
MNPGTQAERQTILVVDDAPLNIEVLSGILRRHYRVKAATSGARALELSRSEAPDLILLDIMMPGLDGLQVCRELKADLRTRAIPVIFVTALGELEDESRGFAAGCVDYVVKPISSPLVLARVRTHLALAQQQRELERQVGERTAELATSRMALIRCLGKAAEFKDDHTGQHVVRMSHYCRLLALAVGCGEAEADLIMHAAPMHDVGKIGIPDRILQKPGPLDADEWAIMQRHVEYGAQILGEHDSELLSLARTIALTHHERWDGQGYPRGLRGEEIPIAGRIAALADVFDALASERPYKGAWELPAVMGQIRMDRGTHFDPLLVDKLEMLLPEFDRIRSEYRDAGIE